MVAIFLAPISAGIKTDKNNNLVAKVEVNVVRADDPLGQCTIGTTTTQTTQTNCTTGKWTNSDSFFDCSGLLPWTDGTCKLAALLYFAVFTPMSAFTWMAAKILDFFVYYSTNSTSYNGDFVAKAWGAVRDIANIFFIVALLYVAIKTILGLNVTDNKKLIGYIVIIALVINFSLFATKVVIDTSNILAKVFYNNITSQDENGKTLDPGGGGQKSISVGLVKQFDPQTIFANNTFKGHEGLFIFVTLLSILLMGFMIYIFFSVALLFVTRVVALWLSMIFSPIAFISYTVPFEMPGFGHKEWWSDLFKNAFLAPIFIFFLYVIILFGDAMKNIPYDVSSTANDLGGYLDSAMKTVIPFVIIFILLQMAKKLAVTYSGKMGEAVGKVGSMIGGVAVGGIVGGTALLGRQTIGRVASNISEKQYFKDFAAKSKIGSGMLKATRGIGSASFDVRGIKVGGMGLPSTLGKAQAGGFTKARKDYSEKQEKFADSLAMSEKERYERSKNGEKLTYTGMETKDEAEEIKRNIDEINRERTLTRATRVEKGWSIGEPKSAANKIAATRIREASRNKAKKLQDALIAATTGEATSPKPASGVGGGTPTGSGIGGGTPTSGHH